MQRVLPPEVSLSGQPGQVNEPHLFIPESTDPTGYTRIIPNKVYSFDQLEDRICSPSYDRSLELYEQELWGHFQIADWVGKTVLDIGGGGFDRFGREARALGATVFSVNPALRDPKHRSLLDDGNSEYWNALWDYQRKSIWQRMLSRRPSRPPVRSLAAVGQALPLRDESCDAVVSVFGVPHYLHHVDQALSADEIVAKYNPEDRERDKEQIRAMFYEVMRVLRKGGSAFFRDDYRAPGQELGINRFSHTDGTEVEEILEELRDKGALATVYTEQLPRLRGGRLFKAVIPDSIGCMGRVIKLQRPE